MAGLGLGLGGIISGIGSLFGGLFGSSASSKASQQYIQALQQAQQWMQGQEQQRLQNYSPYQTTGSTATRTLGNLMSTPGAGLLTPWNQTFTAPTAAQAAQTPGYQFQLQQGENAMQNSAAAQGSLLTGRTLADLNNYAQGTASTNYQNTFNNALTQYQSAYQTFLNNQQNQYNMLSGTAGQGLQAAQGQGNLISGMGANIANLMSGQGAAAAAGTVGSANAWSNALGGAANAIGGGLTLQSLMNNPLSLNPNSWLSVPNNPFAGIPGAPSVPGYAFGTDFAPGGPSIVGEQGPELLNLPRGSQVTPNPATIASGAPVMGGTFSATNPTARPVAPIASPVLGGRFQMPSPWGAGAPPTANPMRMRMLA